MERSFTFEGVTYTIKRPKIRDGILRDRFEAIVAGRPYAFAFADFMTCTTRIVEAGPKLKSSIALNNDASDIGAVEAAYDQFLELDEALIIAWQAEKRLLMQPMEVSAEDESGQPVKKNSR